MKLNWTQDHPCVACGATPTAGVAYGWGAEAETKWWCRDHLPDEYDERKLKIKSRYREKPR